MVLTIKIHNSLNRGEPMNRRQLVKMTLVIGSLIIQYNKSLEIQKVCVNHILQFAKNNAVGIIKKMKHRGDKFALKILNWKKYYLKPRRKTPERALFVSFTDSGTSAFRISR